MTDIELAALVEQYTGLTDKHSPAYAQAYRLAHAVATAATEAHSTTENAADVSADLLPCPFCEGPPEPLVARLIGGGTFPDSELEGDIGLQVTAYVFCHECGAQGESFSSIAHSRSECDELQIDAVKAWQTRDDRHRRLYDYSNASWKELPSPATEDGQ